MDTHQGTRRTSKGTSRLRRAAAAAAAGVLALSGCGMIASVTGKPAGSGASLSQPGQLSEPRKLEGAEPTAYGTDGMAPLTAVSPAGESAALGITEDVSTSPTWEKYYSQKLTWGDCDRPEYSAAKCATLVVPKVWNDPSQGDIELLLTRREATNKKQGSLVLNPGGPGGSGAQFVAEYGTDVVTKKLAGSYDLIGFDPRGVGDSTPITCLSEGEMDSYMDGTYFTAPEDDLEAQAAESKKVFDTCAKQSGDILPYLDTWSAARDLDVIRAALEEDTLDYLGFSYGTYLGGSYAELYPGRVGRFVLDGAVDPQLTADEVAAGQAAGFQESLEEFASRCQSGGKPCPLTGSTPTESAQQIVDFIDGLEKSPLTASDGRQLTARLATTAVISMMYNTANWDILQQGLDEAMQDGSPDVLLLVADFANERQDDGTYKGNSTWAITAVNCLDKQYVTDRAWMDAESERLKKAYPATGEMMGYSGLFCGAWPQKPVRAAAPLTAQGSAPIVVIGTKHDPATPYAWSVALNDQLENSSLITYDGWGHTAYNRSGGCVEKAVDAFFIDGTVPKDGMTCS